MFPENACLSELVICEVILKQHTFIGSLGKVVLLANLSPLTSPFDPAVEEELAPCFLFCCVQVFVQNPLIAVNVGYSEGAFT